MQKERENVRKGKRMWSWKIKRVMGKMDKKGLRMSKTLVYGPQRSGMDVKKKSQMK